MDLLQRYKAFIQKENLFSQKDKLLLAISGGADSVVLCELCKQAGYDFDIAHCNFQLRGEESERDAIFVKNLAEKYNVTFYYKKFDTEQYAANNTLSIQEAARKLRYEWFAELLQNINKPATGNLQSKILTAHHANDSIETMLMNFFKGTGIAGLHGILPKQNNIVRPLLFAFKYELKQFAEENELQYVEDSSNESNKYTRNYFRNQLIPALQKVYPQVEMNLQLNTGRFRETELLYQQAIEWHKKKLLEKKGNEFHIPVLKLQKTIPLVTVIYELVKDFGFTPSQINDVINLLQSESGKFVQSATHRIIKNRNWLIISPNKTEEADNILIDVKGTYKFANGKIKLSFNSNKPFTPDTSPLTAQLDAADIKFPLLLRKCKQGDYFYPLGMTKKKKLSRFFIDNKLSMPQKEKIWVIESDKKILWIVGMRIDNRFKITEKTKQLLHIELIVS